MSGAPRFGDRLRGIYASERNLQREGFYVETIRRTGRLNPGTFYRLTDGKGAFWTYPAENTVPVTDTPEPSNPCGCGPTCQDRHDCRYLRTVPLYGGGEPMTLALLVLIFATAHPSRAREHATGQLPWEVTR